VLVKPFSLSVFTQKKPKTKNQKNPENEKEQKKRFGTLGVGKLNSMHICF
jgi:hypothetical protein